jgi:hypothetical protein
MYHLLNRCYPDQGIPLPEGQAKNGCSLLDREMYHLLNRCYPDQGIPLPEG